MGKEGPKARPDESHAVAETCRSRPNRGLPDPRSRPLRIPDPATASRLDSSPPCQTEEAIRSLHSLRRNSTKRETLSFSRFPLFPLRNGCRGHADYQGFPTAIETFLLKFLSVMIGAIVRISEKTAWGGKPVNSFATGRIKSSVVFLFAFSLAGCGESNP